MVPTETGDRPLKWTFEDSWHVGVAAEAVVTALFARCGYDVSVQYGADQPEYDLMVAKGEKMLKVSVKGSQDGGWGLCQSHIKNADYHGAIDKWASRHRPRTVLCFVQFMGIEMSQMPRVYLASVPEVARRLHDTRKGCGDTILWEDHPWTSRARGAGTVEKIPASWVFSPQRIYELATLAAAAGV